MSTLKQKKTKYNILTFTALLLVFPAGNYYLINKKWPKEKQGFNHLWHSNEIWGKLPAKLNTKWKYPFNDFLIAIIWSVY